MFRQAVFAALLVPVFVVPVMPQQAAAPDTSVTRVTFPQGFATGFRLYDKVDKPDRKIVRYLYINPQALASVKPGEPFPDGTILVMEDHDVALEAGGAPLKSADGRLVPTQRVKAVLVMEKRAGWGETNPFPADKDNGDWEYALFNPVGAPNPVKLDNCHACHLPQKGLDYTFSGAKIFEAAKK
ncbi:MAG: cytochrome P460 family protein [Rhabdaerophilum sp.]